MTSLRVWRTPVRVSLALVFMLGAIYVVRPRLPEPPSADVEPASGLAALPVAEIRLREGDGKGLVAAYCTICHSLRPITLHAGLSRDVWAHEVQKMRQHYGCTLDDETAARIVAYLQTHYGQSETASTAPRR